MSVEEELASLKSRIAVLEANFEIMESTLSTVLSILNKVRENTLDPETLGSIYAKLLIIEAKMEGRFRRARESP
jgi:hypothetical protein